MNFNELQKNWNEMGKTAPFESICTESDGKKIQKWRADEFFETGKKEIDEVMGYVEKLGIKIKRGRALDFGCGAGRLSQALADYFDKIIGVDVALSMINLAEKHNLRPDTCSYRLNERSDLKMFSDNSFDFIYSNITLQHMEPAYAKNYIKEFLRTLAPRGLLIFQLPCGPNFKTARQLAKLFVPEFLLDAYRKIKYADKPRMEMHCVKRQEIVKLLEENGGEIIDIIRNYDAGKDWVSLRYCALKK